MSSTPTSANAPVEIRPVRTARERRLFLSFPWRIYRNDPLWVPPLIGEHRAMIDPRRGSFFKHGTADFLIAWRGGRPVGTIAAGEDTAVTSVQPAAHKDGVFGFFECFENYDVAASLLDRARQWGRERGLARMAGPYFLEPEDCYGILVEGRDRPPVLLCGHTPPYYQTFLERYGAVSDPTESLAFEVRLDHDSKEWEKVGRMADRIRKRGWITLRTPDKARWRNEIPVVQELLNKALAFLPGFTPWQPETVEALMRQFLRIADTELILFAEADGKTVGWFPGVPNINEALIHANGLRYPWDWLRLAIHMRRTPKCLSVKSVLVLPEYQRSGVAVLLFDELRRRARAKGYTWADLSLTGSENPDTPGLAIRLGGRVYKRYRVYRIPV
ncbi:MAG: GNAT family N-acetyltransferase [Spirochaetes bacterium]|nr:GNAT family N-acetyltransferase [Spirochaetota bacterium]